MFARINDELQEREALEKQRQGLLTRKQTLIAENKKRKEDLANLDQDLEKFIDVRANSLSRVDQDRPMLIRLLGRQTHSKNLRETVLRLLTRFISTHVQQIYPCVPHSQGIHHRHKLSPRLHTILQQNLTSIRIPATLHYIPNELACRRRIAGSHCLVLLWTPA